MRRMKILTSIAMMTLLLTTSISALDSINIGSDDGSDDIRRANALSTLDLTGEPESIKLNYSYSDVWGVNAGSGDFNGYITVTISRINVNTLFYSEHKYYSGTSYGKPKTVSTDNTFSTTLNGSQYFNYSFGGSSTIESISTNTGSFSSRHYNSNTQSSYNEQKQDWWQDTGSKILVKRVQWWYDWTAGAYSGEGTVTLILQSVETEKIIDTNINDIQNIPVKLNATSKILSFEHNASKKAFSITVEGAGHAVILTSANPYLYSSSMRFIVFVNNARKWPSVDTAIGESTISFSYGSGTQYQGGQSKILVFYDVCKLELKVLDDVGNTMHDFGLILSNNDCEIDAADFSSTEPLPTIYLPAGTYDSNIQRDHELFGIMGYYSSKNVIIVSQDSSQVLMTNSGQWVHVNILLISLLILIPFTLISISRFAKQMKASKHFKIALGLRLAASITFFTFLILFIRSIPDTPVLSDVITSILVFFISVPFIGIILLVASISCRKICHSSFLNIEEEITPEISYASMSSQQPFQEDIVRSSLSEEGSVSKSIPESNEIVTPMNVSSADSLAKESRAMSLSESPAQPVDVVSSNTIPERVGIIPEPSYKQLIECKVCNGLGRLERCGVCEGKGICSFRTLRTGFLGNDETRCIHGMLGDKEKCLSCKGTGICSVCDGLGMLPSKKGTICFGCNGVGLIDASSRPDGPIKCPVCGTPWVRNADFCQKCGITKKCPKCGQAWLIDVNAESLKFCKYCGFRKPH